MAYRIMLNFKYSDFLLKTEPINSKKKQDTGTFLACAAGSFCWWARGKAGTKQVAKPRQRAALPHFPRSLATCFGPAFS